MTIWRSVDQGSGVAVNYGNRLRVVVGALAVATLLAGCADAAGAESPGSATGVTSQVSDTPPAAVPMATSGPATPTHGPLSTLAPSATAPAGILTAVDPSCCFS
jgi:hypothetical protein